MLLRNGEETTPFTDCKLGPVSVILTRFTVIRGSLTLNLTNIKT